jgi:hypothetical protein
MRSLVLLAALGGCLAAGCSKPSGGGSPVDGSVKVNGKPATGAIVTFHPVNAKADATRPTGHVADDGTFHIAAAEPGEYRVTVSWFASVSPRKGALSDESIPVSQLPPAYTRADATPLIATVTAEQTQPVNFEIKKK